MADKQLTQQATMQVGDRVERFSHLDSLKPVATTTSEVLENRLRLAELEIAHALRIITQKDSDLVAAKHTLEELRGLLQAKEQSLALQRAKIAKLLAENERIGAERAELTSLERRLLHVSPNAHAALADLLAWRQFGQERLGNCFNSADRQLAQLWKYAEEMGSPGHRIVRFITKISSRTWIGRKCTAALYLGYALLKSR